MKTVTDVRHCDDLMEALAGFRASCSAVERWGTVLAARLGDGARLLVAGNGGSAAQAQHLTAELVGRYQEDRPPFSALALHADTSSTTAIANDYGVQEVFARQTSAHGRPGDILMLLSTSGASANLLAAADAAHRARMRVWALTGPAPNPLAGAADEALCVTAPSTATVQELHLVAVHMICETFDRSVEERARARSRSLQDRPLRGRVSADPVVRGPAGEGDLGAGNGWAREAGAAGPDAPDLGRAGGRTREPGSTGPGARGFARGDGRAGGGGAAEAPGGKDHAARWAASAEGDDG